VTETVTEAGDISPPPGSAYRVKFTGAYEHRVLNVGHNVPQEVPHGFAKAVVDADRLRPADRAPHPEE
jgi:hypothetical protein